MLCKATMMPTDYMLYRASLRFQKVHDDRAMALRLVVSGAGDTDHSAKRAPKLPQSPPKLARTPRQVFVETPETITELAHWIRRRQKPPRQSQSGYSIERRIN